MIDSPETLENVRLAVGSNGASMWWLNGEEAVMLEGDRRMVKDDKVSFHYESDFNQGGRSVLAIRPQVREAI